MLFDPFESVALYLASECLLCFGCMFCSPTLLLFCISFVLMPVIRPRLSVRSSYHELCDRGWTVQLDGGVDSYLCVSPSSVGFARCLVPLSGFYVIIAISSWFYPGELHSLSRRLLTENLSFDRLEPCQRPGCMPLDSHSFRFHAHAYALTFIGSSIYYSTPLLVVIQVAP